MTDKEAFELVVKYGGERTVLMIKEMIHVEGVEATVKNIKTVFKKNIGKIPKEFEEWIEQGCRHVYSEMNQPLN